LFNLSAVASVGGIVRRYDDEPVDLACSNPTARLNWTGLGRAAIERNTLRQVRSCLS
jgi:hypothetical protein